MSIRPFPNHPFLVGGICLLLMGLLYSCGFSGLESDSPKPLGKFYGKVIGNFPTPGNPRLAVVWQSSTGDLFFWDGGRAAITRKDSVYAGFSGDFSTLPDTGISSPGSDFIVGQLWLYDDANPRNGHLDWQHPAGYDDVRGNIALARQTLLTSMNQLMSYADTVVTPVASVDSFLVKNGDLYLARSPLPQAILKQDVSSGMDVKWRTLLKARYRVLFHPNKWEAFFNPNGNFTSRDFRIRTMGLDTVVSVCQLVRYQPQPGKESDFEQALQHATLAQVLVDSLINEAKSQINDEMQPGLSPQPFENVLGRSAGDTLQDFIVYFSDVKSKEAMAEAEKASGFFFALKEKFNVGFNLVECDYQRNCKVLTWGHDSVSVSVAAQSPTMVFSPQSISPAPFISTHDSVPYDTNNVTNYSGQYLNPFGGDSLRFLQSSAQHFGMDFPPYGILAFYYAGKDRFFHRDSALAIDLQFASNKGQGLESPDTVSKMVGVVIDQRKSPPESVQFYSLNPDIYIRDQDSLALEIEFLFGGR